MSAQNIDLLWLDEKDTAELTQIAKSGKGDPMKFMKNKAPDIATWYGGLTEPLALIVVNTTPDNLSVAECEDIHGNLEYQAWDANTDSACITAAPLEVYGKGASTVGVWMFGSGIFTQRPTGVIKFSSIPSLGDRPAYVGGAVRDFLQYNCSIGNHEHGSCQDYYDKYMDDGKPDFNATSSASEGCYCATSGEGINSIVVTAVIA